MVPDNRTGKNLCVWLSQHTNDQTKQACTSFRLLPDIFTAAVWGKDYFVDCEVWNLNRPEHSSVMFVVISRWAAEVTDSLVWHWGSFKVKHTNTILCGFNIYFIIRNWWLVQSVPCIRPVRFHGPENCTCMRKCCQEPCTINSKIIICT